MTFELIDTPDKAVQTLGATMDRLRQLAYRIPPDEDGHGAVTWQEKYEQAVGLLAEAGMLLDAIRARDGVPLAFDNLVDRISEALGGDILKAAWDTRERRRP